MRIVEVVENFSKNGTDFKKGHRYVMAEDNEGQLRNIAGNNLGMSYPLEDVYRPYRGEDLTNKRLMAWRTGGIGDLHFLLPVLNFLKHTYKGCFLRIASGCKQPLENVPAIDELYNMPFDAKLLEDMDYHLMFQGIIEGESSDSKKTHAVDMFYKYFSIDPVHISDEFKRPKLFFTKEEMDWLRKENAQLALKEDDYVIGIQMESSSPVRNFPKEKMKMIVDVLAKEAGVKILLIGNDQQRHIAGYYKGNYPNVIPAINYDVRKSIVLANRYDLIIAPDSFMVQTAGGLDKPLIGLYGPFPSDVRMKYFKNAIGIEPKVVCSPCFKHDFRGCIKGHPSPCFSQVNPEDVLQAVNYQRFKVRGTCFKYMEHFMRTPDMTEAEKYMLSADKGLCFFGGYFNHHNIIKVDSNKFCGADITDLNTQFQRESYPFVVFMNHYNQGNGSLFNGCKGLVRPGGYFIATKLDANEQFYNDMKRDLGRSFVLLHTTFNPATRTVIVVGKKNY